MRKLFILFLFCLALCVAGGNFKGKKRIADYNVAVNPELNPDCSGNYFTAGTHDSQPYYRRADGAWFLWWYLDAGYWHISTEAGVVGSYYWFRGPAITGNYSPGGSTIGTATVAVGAQ